MAHPASSYLGGKLSLVETANGTKTWQFSSSQYVQEAVSNVEKYLAATDRILPPRRRTTPLSTNYRPEIDTTCYHITLTRGKNDPRHRVPQPFYPSGSPAEVYVYMVRSQTQLSTGITEQMKVNNNNNNLNLATTGY